MDVVKAKPYLNKNYIIIALALVIVALVVVFSGVTRYIPGVSAPATGPTGGIGTTTTTTSGVTLNQQQAGSDTGKPVMDALTGQQTGVQCPKDFCLNAVYGAGKCPSSAETYYEQECYKYPASAKDLATCDKQRTIYYKVCGVA
ncbi:hypothetical protein EPN87_03360 [archaeon]|nr:MAG: hypothetical protein EPN87_03360 [archaeon]